MTRVPTSLDEIDFWDLDMFEFGDPHAAWTLQRSLVPPPSAIPDVLAIRAPHERDPGFVLACEVDLGGERVKGVFAPKLVKLASLLRTWAAGAPASSCSPAANVVPRSSGVPWPNSKFAP